MRLRLPPAPESERGPRPELPAGVEPLLDREEAAVFCGCSPSHIDRLVKVGLPRCDLTLPGAKRRTLRFDPAALREWAAQRARQNGGGK